MKPRFSYGAYMLLILALLIAPFFLSCSKSSSIDEPNTEPDKTLSTRLTSLLFEPSSNPSLPYTCRGIINGHTIYVTLPEKVKLSELVPTIAVGVGKSSVAVAEAASNALGVEVLVNNKKIESGVTKCDFSGTATILVQTTQGTLKNGYYVCAKNGRPEIDNLVYAFMTKYKIPGISFSSSKHEHSAYAAGYGFADTSSKERVTTKHLFRLASMTKCQTALCIMKLCEQGKLSLDDFVFGKGGLLEKEFGDAMPGPAKTVTVRNFLQHNSGWISSPVDPVFTNSSTYSGKTLEERIAYVVSNVAQTYAPGEKYSYYNLGFGILGKIIEKISGKEYGEFLKDEIYAPAGITDMHIGGGRAERRSNEVVYYSQDGAEGYNNDMQLIKALGGLIASTDELVKLLSYIDYGTEVPDFLSKSTLDKMYTPSGSYAHYALGWRVNHSVFTDWVAYHTGNLAGTATVWVRGASTTCGALLCNSRSYQETFDTELLELANSILSSVNSSY
jgi:D-alanyl-D-alanine carboxypeptidase